MPPSAAPRKRTRKRKRRALSVSSSSSSSSSDSETEVVEKKALAPPPVPAAPSSSSESSSSDSDSDSDSTDSEQAAPTKPTPAATAAPPPRRNSPSPPPPSAELATFLPPRDAPTREDAEEAMKARFNQFWMASVADGFKDDLEDIRVKEPHLGASRLALLIDSLASGAEVFTSTAQGSNGVNEMEVVLE